MYIPPHINPAELTTGSHFESILKKPDECGSSCPSGAYLIQDSNGLNQINKTLISQGQRSGAAAWENNRYALLVKPNNEYKIDPVDGNNFGFQLGFFTQILGVGTTPEAVVFNPGVEVFNQCYQTNMSAEECKRLGGLNNFWRGVENIGMSGHLNDDPPLRFAASQASPLRRLDINSKFVLCDWWTINTADIGCGYTSGGFFANSKINALVPGSQQQFIVRNSTLESTESATWNMVSLANKIPTPAYVFPGETTPHRAPEGSQWAKCEKNTNCFPLTIMNDTPRIREKPFIYFSENNWKIARPSFVTNTSGHDFMSLGATSDLNDDYIIISANPDSSGVTNLDQDFISTLNTTLESGKHLLVMPGVYTLQSTIKITNDDTLVLGLGLPSLTCMTEEPCMLITAEKGVQLAGLTFDAGYKRSNNLLQIGVNTNSNDNSNNPIFLYDVFARIAETQKTQRSENEERQLKTAITIYTNNVVGDNLWLWRADHDKASGDNPKNSENLVNWDMNQAEHGLIVYGDDVKMYGLFTEHFRDYQTVWYGENGEVNFYQSEFPYDVPRQSDWKCHDPQTGVEMDHNQGCASLIVNKNVQKFTAKGLGIYSFFATNDLLPPKKPGTYQEQIIVKSGFKAPVTNHVTLEHVVTRWLDGQVNSGILNVGSGYDADQCLGLPAYCSAIQKDANGFNDCKSPDAHKTSVIDTFSNSLNSVMQCHTKFQ